MPDSRNVSVRENRVRWTQFATSRANHKQFHRKPCGHHAFYRPTDGTEFNDSVGFSGHANEANGAAWEMQPRRPLWEQAITILLEVSFPPLNSDVSLVLGVQRTEVVALAGQTEDVLKSQLPNHDTVVAEPVHENP